MTRPSSQGSAGGTDASPGASAPTPAENPLISLIFNIALPAIVLSKLSTEDRLGPVYGLLAALAFPVAYGAWDFATRRKHNFISILGFVSVLLTGGLGLLKLEGFWFAVKEAAVPAIIAIVLIVSHLIGSPLVRMLVYNDTIVDRPVVEAELTRRNAQEAFERLLASTTWLIAGSFVLSSVLNFVLARILLTATPGTPEFNAQLGKMTALSYPVIALPCIAITGFAIWRVMAGIRNLTGLTLEQVFRAK